MIEAAEREGRLKPGGTIVEATSGNTGIGLALAAIVKGYKTIFVMTEKVAMEKRRYLRALGAEVVIRPMNAKPDSPEYYVNTARLISEETPNSIFIYQYANPANPEIHYRTTGPEIWNDTDGKITHFVASIGTGGTISGAGKYLKEKNPDIKVIGADPIGSIFKTYKETNEITEGIPYLVEGIGQDCLPDNVNFNVIDQIINVSDKDSIKYCRMLSREEGLFCGGSTGTIAKVALDLARGLDENAVVVFTVCDTGERYLTKYHSDEWLREKQLLDTDTLTAGIILQTKNTNGTPDLVTVATDNTVEEALELMNNYNLSLLPVMNGADIVGSVREHKLTSKVVQNKDLLCVKISEVMDEKLPEQDINDDVKTIIKKLKENPAVLVSEFGKISGILTRYDVLDFV
jgi:cystathionine beta-synthase